MYSNDMTSVFFDPSELTLVDVKGNREEERDLNRPKMILTFCPFFTGIVNISIFQGWNEPPSARIVGLGWVGLGRL